MISWNGDDEDVPDDDDDDDEDNDDDDRNDECDVYDGLRLDNYKVQCREHGIHILRNHTDRSQRGIVLDCLNRILILRFEDDIE